MKLPVPENKKIAPFLVFYIVPSSQIGLGALGFQRMIAKDAGTDGWISVIIGGILLMLLMMIIYKMLEMVNGDLFDVHSFVFGEKISKFLSLIFILYFGLKTITVLRGYIEIIQVWMFPELQTFWFGLAFFLLVIFIVYGGFRMIVGFSVFSLFILLFITPLFLFTIPYAEPLYLFPILSHSLSEIFNGVAHMSYTYLGFEIILFIYPFLKAPKKSKKWALFGLLFTTCFYTYLAVLTYMYYPESALEKIIWASLSMWKIIEMPFIERFEYIGIAAWFIIILPHICYYLWISSRLFKQSFSVRQKITVPIFAALCLIVMSLFLNRKQINTFIELTGIIGLYLTFIYLPILFIFVLIARKVKQRA